MKIEEMRRLTSVDLRARESELAEQLLGLRIQQVTGQLEKPARVRQVRRDMARVLTVLRESRGERGGI